MTNDKQWIPDSRRSAIAAGALIDVTEAARKAGFNLPVAVTRGAWIACVAVYTKESGLSEDGKLLELLRAVRAQISLANVSAAPNVFVVGVGVEDFCGLPYTLHVAAETGQDDDGAPCLTVAMPHEPATFLPGSEGGRTPDQTGTCPPAGNHEIHGRSPRLPTPRNRMPNAEPAPTPQDDSGQRLSLPPQFVFSYSRAQAIADGVLVDVTDTATEAGFRLPVAMTAAAWAEYVQVPHGVDGQDEDGRLWDVLFMLGIAIRKDSSGNPELLFQLHVRNDNSEGEPPLVTLRAVCGPSDDLSPCVTIMLPDED